MTIKHYELVFFAMTDYGAPGVIATFESDTPFMSIHAGDFIGIDWNVQDFPQYEGLSSARVTKVEHNFEEARHILYVYLDDAETWGAKGSSGKTHDGES